VNRSRFDQDRRCARDGSTRRVVAAGALVVGLVVLASLRLDGLPQPAPAIAIADATSDTNVNTTTGAADTVANECTRPTFLRPDGEPVPDGTTQRLNSNTFRLAYVCEPSLLTLRAEGSAVDGVGARLVIGWHDRTLFDQPIDGEAEVRVEVPGAGWVVVAFANDLYRPPLDRNLVVHTAHFTPLVETRP